MNAHHLDLAPQLKAVDRASARPATPPTYDRKHRTLLKRVVAQTALWLQAGLIPLSPPAVAQTGTLDPSFAIGAGITGPYVHAMAVSPHGKILVGGNFTRVQGIPRGYVAQFNSDGSLDSGFSPAPGAAGEVLAVAYQADGKVLIGGVFSRVNTVGRNRVARLNADGALDPSFDPGTGATAEIRSIAVQPDGKILIGGPFVRFNGSACNGIARLNPDGTLDPDFNTGAGVGGERFIDEVHVLDNGTILIAGDFPTYDGVKRANIARLHSDGSLDTSFDPGAGAKPGDPVLGVTIQPDGKILIVGSFTAFGGKPLKNLARLNPDGSLDPAFDPGAGTSGGPINGLLQAVALEPDGKILIGGWFDRVNGVPRPYLAQLLASGKPDTNWNVRVDGQVRTIGLQPDGKILIGGDFGRVNTLPNGHLARLNPSGPVPVLLRKCERLDNGEMELELVGAPGHQYLLQVSADLVRWETWKTMQCGNGSLLLTDPDATLHSVRFYRALPIQ
jgi:uncharacterized delta-60 repeat protein